MFFLAYMYIFLLGALVAQLVKNLLQYRRPGLIGSGRSTGEGNSYPLQYSDLENSMDNSLPSFSVHGILQARILVWVAISSSGDLPNPGIKPGSPALQADSLPTEPPGNLYSNSRYYQKYFQSNHTRYTLEAVSESLVSSHLYQQ